MHFAKKLIHIKWLLVIRRILSLMSKTKHKIGLVALISLAVGNAVGSGIFMLPASLAKIGSISLLSWVFTTLGALFLAFVFVKISARLPKTGGPYAYAREGFGNFVGFQVAFIYWIATLISNVSLIIVLIGYLHLFSPTLANQTFDISASLVVIWLFTFVNISGVHSVGKVQIITTIIKCTALLLVTILGVFYFHPSYLTSSFNLSHTSNLAAFSYAATLTFWAFVGMESATIPAEHTENPKRNIPVATILGVLITAFIYIASSTVIMGMLPAHTLANSTFPFSTAARLILGNWGAWIIGFGAIISCLGTFNGWTLIQGQMTMAMADDNLFPKVFAKRNKHNVPAWGLVIGAILTSLIVLATTNPNLVEQFQVTVLVSSVAFLITYLYTIIAEMMYLPKDKKGIIKTSASFIAAILAGVYICWAFFGSGEKIIFYFMVMLIATIPLYAFFSAKKRAKSIGSF